MALLGYVKRCDYAILNEYAFDSTSFKVILFDKSKCLEVLTGFEPIVSSIVLS